MDIEGLKELRGAFDSGQVTDQGYAQDQDDILALIDAEIARQSVTSEEVTEAIEELMSGIWQLSKDGYPITLGGKTLGLAITALQAYQPTTRKDRTVEEVAISKTETTTDQPLCSECRLYQRFVLGDGVK